MHLHRHLGKCVCLSHWHRLYVACRTCQCRSFVSHVSWRHQNVAKRRAHPRPRELPRSIRDGDIRDMRRLLGCFTCGGDSHIQGGGTARNTENEHLASEGRRLYHICEAFICEENPRSLRDYCLALVRYHCGHTHTHTHTHTRSLARRRRVARTHAHQSALSDPGSQPKTSYSGRSFSACK